MCSGFCYSEQLTGTILVKWHNSDTSYFENDNAAFVTKEMVSSTMTRYLLCHTCVMTPMQ